MTRFKCAIVILPTLTKNGSTEIVPICVIGYVDIGALYRLKVLLMFWASYWNFAQTIIITMACLCRTRPF